ncbi:MAG: hypothetical protein ACXVW9_04950 [Nocardioidaceae bacterium]
MTLLGWSAALTGALGYGIASLLQALGSARATGPAVLRQPAYVAGLALDGLAWLASLVALRVLPLFVVQATLGGSVAVTVVLAHRFLRAPLRRRDAGSIVLLVAALAVLAGAFLSGRPAAAAGLTAWALSALAGLALALAVGYHRASSLPLAVVAGLAFSGAAVCARGVDLTGGPATVAAQPLAWALLGFGAVGTLGYARSLERGPVGPATAALWSVESVVAGVAGVLVLGDTVRPGWTLAATLAAVVSVLSCAALATSPAEKTLEPSAP